MINEEAIEIHTNTDNEVEEACDPKTYIFCYIGNSVPCFMILGKRHIK